MVVDLDRDTRAVLAGLHASEDTYRWWRQRAWNAAENYGSAEEAAPALAYYLRIHVPTAIVVVGEVSWDRVDWRKIAEAFLANA